jgi:glyoxylase-like metal-dependent hydrolase (beta-lactamase superfamily II)
MAHFTKRTFLAAGACACCAGTVGRGFAATSPASVGTFGDEGLPTLLELGTEPMTRIGETVWVARIAPQLWLHTTTATIEGGYVFPANGLIVERPHGSLLIDTGYAPDQSELLLQWSNINLASPISSAIATHFHRDRTGGIEGLKAHRVHTLASPLTCEFAKAHGLPLPEPIKNFAERPFRFAADCELFFPGAGHTHDNIVAWIPKHQILFGGCFLKSVTSEDLGNVADADIPDWPASVRRARAQYTSAKTAVPGHGSIAGDPVAQTLALLAKSGVPN